MIEQSTDGEQLREIGADDFAAPDALFADQASPFKDGDVLLHGGKAHRVMAGELDDALLTSDRAADDVAASVIGERAEHAIEVGRRGQHFVQPYGCIKSPVKPANVLVLHLRLDAYPYRNIIDTMARAATTSDVFNAIAEPQRREILVLLRAGERPVTELAQALRMTQPGATKHLRVLREVGLVRDRKAGKQRLYALDARELRPVHEWTGGFERFWNESFARLDAYVQDLTQTMERRS